MLCKSSFSNGAKFITFTAELVRETSYSSYSLGHFYNRMSLCEYEEINHDCCIEWEYGRSPEELCDVTYIGISYDVAPISGARILSDYDGLFSLPLEAIILLEWCGIEVPQDFRDEI